MRGLLLKLFTPLAICLVLIVVAITANTETDVKKCEYHGIDADICTRCNPELIPEFKARGDWCAGHNVAESQCELCDFGKAHEIEDENDGHDHEAEVSHDDNYGHLENEASDGHEGCTHALHNEDVSEVTEINNTVYRELKRESEFTVFFPENVGHCTSDDAIIQLASIKTAERAGLTIRPAVAIEASPFIEAPGEIVFDETQIKVLSTTIPSLVSQWMVEPGQRVSRGTLLARLSSPELPKLKAEYLEAHASWLLAKNNFDRQKNLYDRELISDSDYESSETEFVVADARMTGLEGMLKSAGLSEVDLKKIIDEKQVNQFLHLYAPDNGVIIERIAILGQFYEEGQPLAIIGNPEALWIEASVREEDAPYFSLGDRMEFSPDGNGFKKCHGKIIWISQYLNKNSRSITVRAEIEASSGNLNSGEFGRIVLDCREKSEMVLIPKDAVQWEGCCNVVFVRENIDRFRPRKVKIEPGDNGYYRVTEGLLAGEEIVVEGSYLLKTELRKGSIGAGCCGH